jgi:uroporphyrin-3 C-methyltransferase
MPEQTVAPPPSPPVAGHPHHQRWLTPAFILALLALVFTLGFAWHTEDRMQDLRVQLARRIGEFDTASREARAAAKEAQTVLDDMRARLAALEGRAQEAQNQQLALSAMYQDLARGQDERVVADVEQTLLLAQQQLQLAGNLRAAIIGLEAAESRLAGLNKHQFDPLRAAISRDVERLKLLPGADIVSLNARLEVLTQSVDKLRLEPAPGQARPSVDKAADVHLGKLEQLAWSAWQEVRQLVRIRRSDQAEPPLLTPDQAWFLRQNLRLRLHSARMAAFQRDQATYRADLAAARDWVTRYFDRDDPIAKSMWESLGNLMEAPVSQGEGDIRDSLKALQAFRGGDRS